ncbi:hypothetical protein ACN38_g11421 [Penicillium nordicum]|uniref:C2H2-type domain-containing protein n=1 Tax=Penicillium nordicum TaxID=229535 RepID=A0A0M8NR89_9EURO|nr:hypothetical protein ACN38_g11421 [Penicillium nordicum]
MDSTFNNEEVDETIEWPVPPSSFTSSEDYYAYYHTATHSSADVTSLTSSEAFPYDSEWFNGESINQMPEPPQQYENDLDGMDLRFYETDENIPQDLADDLGSSIITQRPAEDIRCEGTAHPPGVLDRTAMGIPNSTPLSLQPSEGAINQAFNTWWAVTYNQPCGHDQISQVVQTLEAMMVFLRTKIPAPPVSLSESSRRGKKMFRCWQCDPRRERTTFPTFGTFKRHLTGHGILDCEWRCTEPRCRTVLHRRDRMHDHLLRKHKRSGLLPADVEATRVRYAPPANCPFCSEKTSSWSVYYEHIKTHCIISPHSANVSASSDRSHHGDNGGGNGNGHGHGPSSAGPSNWHGESQYNRTNNRTGGPSYSSTSFGGFMSRSNAHPDSMPHSVSDEQPNSNRRQSATDAIEQSSIDNSLGSSRRPRSHLPRASGQPKNIQPPQNPRSSQADHSTKRKRSDKQKAPTEEKAPSPNKCRRCYHDMAECPECKSVRSCHRCGDTPRSAIQAGPSSRVPVQALSDSSSTIIDLNESYFNPGPSANFVMPQNMPTQLPYYNPNEMVHLFDPRPFENLTNTFMDDPPPYDYVIRSAMDVGSHPPLSEFDDKMQESVIFERDIKILRSVGLSTSIDPLSVKRQTIQPKPKASGGPAPGSYTDLVFRDKGSSPILDSPKPISTCQCPCVTIPTVDYKAHASLKLSDNERVEMTFKMSPARESNHPLRTRVRVFVKIFSLRASAAKANTKKQRNHSITSETLSDDDAESATNLDQELTPTSSSGSELTPLLYWTEDVQDWEFSFDVKSALTKLAQWTSGIDADMCQKLLLSDPRHILDLISMYIVYNFKISWLLMGRNGFILFLSSTLPHLLIPRS